MQQKSGKFSPCTRCLKVLAPFAGKKKGLSLISRQPCIFTTYSVCLLIDYNGSTLADKASVLIIGQEQVIGTSSEVTDIH